MKKLLVFSAILILFACGHSEDDVPENIIPKEEFVDLLVNIQLMESYCQNKYVRPDLYKDLLVNSIDSLLKENGRTIEEYEESFEFYSMRPKVMFQVYEEVLERINTLELETNAVAAEKSE